MRTARPLYVPSKAFSILSCLRPALLAFILLSLLFLGGGCGQDQLQLAAQQATVLQQNIATAQQELKDLQAKIAAEKEVLTTQPATTQAVAQLNKDEEKAKQISDWLDKARPVVDQLAQAANAVANGQQPNFTGLSAFGAYGTLAALVLSVGWGAWQTYTKQQQAKVVNTQAQTIAAQQPVIDHIQEITGTSNPVSAAAALTSPAVPVAPEAGVSPPPAPASFVTPPVPNSPKSVV